MEWARVGESHLLPFQSLAPRTTLILGASISGVSFHIVGTPVGRGDLRCEVASQLGTEVHEVLVEISCIHHFHARFPLYPHADIPVGKAAVCQLANDEGPDRMMWISSFGAYGAVQICCGKLLFSGSGNE